MYLAILVLIFLSTRLNVPPNKVLVDKEENYLRRRAIAVVQTETTVPADSATEESTINELQLVAVEEALTMPPQSVSNHGSDGEGEAVSTI